MPKFKIYDNKTGRTLVVNGAAPPTEEDATELFAPFHGVPPALASNEQATAIPGMGQIPDQTGRGGNPVGLKPQDNTQPKPPGWSSLVDTPLTNAMATPLATHLPESAQNYLKTRESGGSPLNIGPYVGNLAKAAAQRITPTHLALAASMVPSGGLSGAIGAGAGGLLAAEGAASAVNPEKSQGDRISGGLNAVLGLAGVGGSLGKVSEGLANAGKEAGQVKKSIALTPELQKLEDAFAVADSKLNTNVLKDTDKAFLDRLKVKYDRLAMEDAATKAQGKASETMGHFNTLDPKSAAEEAKRLSLARSQQALDELSQTAGQAPKPKPPTTKATLVDKLTSPAPSVEDVMFTPVKPKLSAAEFKAKGGSALGNVTPEPPTAVEQLVDKLGTPTTTNKPLRTEDVLRGSSRFQDLPKEERARRYKELGGLDAEAKKLKVPANPPEGIDPSTLYAGLNPALLKNVLKVPSARAAIGGTVGYNLDEEHPYAGAAAGAGIGMLAAPTKYGGMSKALENLTAGRYEALLFGAPQGTNLAGNIGGAAAAPAIEALRGNIPGAIRLAKHYADIGKVVPEWLKAFLSSVTSSAPITRFGKPVKTLALKTPFGELPGAGRLLQAVDTATKGSMHSGGLDQALAGHYTLSELPSTDAGKWMKKFQDFPGGQMIEPFMNTAIKANEMALALSPARWAPGMGENLRKMVPAVDYVTKGGRKIPKKVFETALAAPSLIAGGAGLAGMHAPGEDTIGQVPASALLGPFALPYQTGRQIRDYAKYGREKPSDVVEAVVNNVPIAGSIPKDVQNPSKFLTDIPAQFVPQIMQAIGDKTVRDTNADSSKTLANRLLDEAENAIKSRLPWERTSLPSKNTFLGDEKKRNWLGQYPAADYETDPTAARLANADPSILRRAPNQSLGGLGFKDKWDLLNNEDAMNKLYAGKPGLKALVEGLTTPQEESDLGKLRGKSTRTEVEAIMNTPWFQDLLKTKKGKQKQDLLLSEASSEGSKAGTDVFKAKRTIEIARKAKE